MKTLAAYIVAHNEVDLLKGCVERILPFVDELLLVDHGSNDGTTKLMYDLEREDPKKISVVETEYSEPVDMGKLRTSCYSLLKSDWVLAVDADEYYPAETMDQIREAIDHANKHEHVSFRVNYHNLSWRFGYIQANFEHAPDRLYRRDVVDFVGGVLPNDMTHVKKDFYTFRPYLEYDNEKDESFVNPKQPILDVYYYHLARTRGYNFELQKWTRYNKNIHPDWPLEKAKEHARINQWVSGIYSLWRPSDLDTSIPMKSIKNPKVSIVITNFNYGKYLTECVTSCVNQTVKPHEVIVVDDASTDDSKEVISTLSKNNLVTNEIYHLENKGVQTARNAGIAASTGDYFVCVDADDMLEPTFIEETLKEMEGDVQIVYTDMSIFDDFHVGHHEFPEFSRIALRQAQIIPSCCALIDRHCFEVAGGYDPNMHYEDWAWWLRLDYLGFKFKHIKKPLFNYRRHKGSRIDKLDEHMDFGRQQLNQLYGVPLKQ